MFSKIRKLFFGAGLVDPAELVREIVCNRESQSVLFESGNAHVLKAYVEYGHSFSPASFLTFLQVANRALVKTYLSMGFELGETERQAVLDLNDDELTSVMIGSGSWSPFPSWNDLYHSAGKHCERELEAKAKELGPTKLGVVVSA